MDHDEAGDGIRRLGEAKGTFPETFGEIKPLEPYQDSPFPLWSLMESWRTWRFLTKLVMVSGGQENPLEASLKISSKSDNRFHVKW